MTKKVKLGLKIVILFFLIELTGYMVAKNWKDKLPGYNMAVEINRKWELKGNHQLTETGEILYKFWKIVGIKNRMWQTDFIFWILWQPLFLFIIFLAKKDKRILIIIGFALWIFINRENIRTKLPIKTFLSNDGSWIWVYDEEKPSPYTEFVYKINLKKSNPKAIIKIASLGRYQLIINGTPIYWGPSFGVEKLVYFDEIDITKNLIKGNNEIKIITNYINRPIHSYSFYEKPGIWIDGYIQTGLFYYDLANYKYWKGGTMLGWQNGLKIMDSGNQDKFDLTLNNKLENVNLIKRDFEIMKRPLPLLQFDEIELNNNFQTGYIKWTSNFEEKCTVKLRWTVNNNNYFDQNDEWIIPSGNFEYTQFNRRAGSKLIIDKGDCKGDYKIKIIVPKSQINLINGENKIINISNQTLKNNIQDQFEDCPDREKAMYVGDVLADSKCLISQKNNWQYIRQVINIFGLGQNKNGSIPSMVPSGKTQLIPSYSLMWPVLMEMYTTQSGDKSVVMENKYKLEKLVKWAENNEDNNGFLVNKNNENWWMFTDWTEGEYTKYSINTPLQLWYVKMLKSMEILDEKNSEKYKIKNRKLMEKLYKYGWNKELNIWVDSFDTNNQSTGGIIINSLAGKFGLFNNKNEEEKTWNYFTNKLTKTAYSETWIIDWGLKLNKYDDVKNIIDSYWGEMLKQGYTSWPEIFDPITKKNEGSVSHSWGCGPSYLIPILESKEYSNLITY